MKTPTIVRLVSACSAALISFALLDSVAMLGRLPVHDSAQTRAAAKQAVAKAPWRQTRSATP